MFKKWWMDTQRRMEKIDKIFNIIENIVKKIAKPVAFCVVFWLIAAFFSSKWPFDFKPATIYKNIEEFQVVEPKDIAIKIENGFINKVKYFMVDNNKPSDRNKTAYWDKAKTVFDEIQNQVETLKTADNNKVLAIIGEIKTKIDEFKKEFKATFGLPR